MILIALVLSAAQPAPAASADPGEAIRTTAIAYSNCIKAKVGAAPKSGTPESAADSVLAACAAEDRRLRAAVDAQLAVVPEAQRAEARKQVDEGLAEGRASIVDAIRQSRAAPTAPAN